MENNCNLSRWQLLKSKLNNLDPKAFRAAFEAAEQGMLLDCRKAEEVAVQGKITGSVNIDYLAYDFWEQIEQLDVNRPYFVCCRSGRRSIRACTLMQNGGFNQVYNLDGGLNAWVEEFGEAALEKVGV